MDDNLIKKIQELTKILSKSKVYNIYKKYYTDIRLDLFHDIIMVDPTIPIKNKIPDKLGQYSKWLLSIYRKGKLKKEDLYKAYEYLKIYNELKRQNLLIDDAKDIGKITSLPELFILTSKLGGTGQIQDDENYLLSDRYFINNGKVNLVFENKRWLIVNPNIFEASKFYASTSQWCTRFPDNYQHYVKDGPLYIIIDKMKLNQNDATRRYQFHFESNQFMNMNDSPIDIGEFIKNNPSISDALSVPIIHYVEIHYELNNTILSLLGVIIERNPHLVDKFMPALEERIKKGLPIPEQIIDSIPGLRELQINIFTEHGWTISEKYLMSLEPEERQKAIEKKLSKFGSDKTPFHYFKNADNKLKVFYYKDLINRGGQLPLDVTTISDPKLINYYIEQMSTMGKKIPTMAYEMATDAQKERYRKGLLSTKVHLMEPEQFIDLNDDEKSIYINKYVDNMYTYMPNNFFNVLSKNLKNYYIAKIAKKKDLSKVSDFLTIEQYNWATTEGFL